MHRQSSRGRIPLFLTLASLTVAGCFDQVSVQEAGAESPNAAPIITGTPATVTRVGGNYVFTPVASDRDGDTLTFDVLNLPPWATFSSHSGRISGTPGPDDTGTYAHITISVTDGEAVTTLPAFALVVDPPAHGGTVTLNWDAPIEDTDGAPLDSLAGFRVYYGTARNALERRVQITDPSALTHVVENLQPATWYFAVSAYTSSGVESELSKVVSKVIE